MLFMETIIIYCENHTKQVSTLSHKTQSFWTLGQAVNIYDYHWALNGQTPNIRTNTKLPDQRHQITDIHNH